MAGAEVLLVVVGAAVLGVVLGELGKLTTCRCGMRCEPMLGFRY